MIANSAVAFAVTYFLGVILTVTFLSKIAPKLIGGDLVADCKQLEKEMGLEEKPEGESSAYAKFVTRAYKVPAEFSGQAVAALEDRFKGARVFVQRIRRGSKVQDPRPDDRLEAGDIAVARLPLLDRARR